MQTTNSGAYRFAGVKPSFNQSYGNTLAAVQSPPMLDVFLHDLMDLLEGG